MKTTKQYYLPILALSFLIYLGSCNKNTVDTSFLYVPTNADTTAHATLEELQQGRILYIDNCAACHGLYSPDNYTYTQWESILASMAPRTSMSPYQIQMVNEYVTRGQ